MKIRQLDKAYIQSLFSFLVQSLLKLFSRFISQETYRTNLVSNNLNNTFQGSSYDSDFYISKFNTKHNLTEWYYQSNVIGVNETVRGLKYSEKFELIFIAIEIQGNTFLNSTSDEDL